MKKPVIIGIATSIIQDSGISIIRLSGDGAVEKVNQFLKYSLIDQKNHYIKYNEFFHKKKFIDEVMVVKHLAPNSYTGEEVVEINCHGGSSVTNQILQIIISSGVKLAERGEFTKRAFLNNKKSLLEAQGVFDIIAAQNETALAIAQSNLSGQTTTLIQDLYDELIEIISFLEVNIDYPEYETVDTKKLLNNKINLLVEKIKKIYENSKNGSLLTKGINLAIIGKPNVGKSTLINYLAQDEIAIVTDIKGTTRDIIQKEINFHGMLINLMDTAGIHDSDDIVEKIGIERSLQAINSADIVIAMFDGSQPESNEDKKILKLIDNKVSIKIINKNDQKIKYQLDDSLNISLKSANNLEQLAPKIKEKLNLVNIDTTKVITSQYQIEQLKMALNHLLKAKNNIENNEFEDIIFLDLREALLMLGSILGINTKEDVINNLFKKFCLGK